MISVPNNILLELLDGATNTPMVRGGNEYKFIADQRQGSTRWEEQHLLVFKFGNRLYGAVYSMGLTEGQPNEYFGFGYYEDIETHIACREVVGEEVTRIRYGFK